MTKYEYRVVPFIGQLKQGVFSRENATKVSEQLGALINEQAKDGWEFYRIDHVNVAVQPGCLASLFGANKAVAGVVFDQVIFRRVVE